MKFQRKLQVVDAIQFDGTNGDLIRLAFDMADWTFYMGEWYGRDGAGIQQRWTRATFAATYEPLDAPERPAASGPEAALVERLRSKATLLDDPQDYTFDPDTAALLKAAITALSRLSPPSAQKPEATCPDCHERLFWNGKSWLTSQGNLFCSGEHNNFHNVKAPKSALPSAPDHWTREDQERLTKLVDRFAGSVANESMLRRIETILDATLPVAQAGRSK